MKAPTLTAYLVSKSDYETMVDRLRVLEDRLWLIEAESARKGGFVSAAKVDELLNRLGDASDEEASDRSTGFGRSTTRTKLSFGQKIADVCDTRRSAVLPRFR